MTEPSAAATAAAATKHASAPAPGSAPARRLARAPWLALPLGALQSLAFAPTGWWPLGILCLAALFWLWRDAPPRRAAWTGFAFVFGLFLAGTYWLYTSIHGFGKAPIPLALFLMLGMVSIMGSYAAAIGWALARWFPRRGPLGLLVVVPAAWIAMEWFRGWFLSGFPWLAIGYAPIDSPLGGYAPVFGVYGVGLVAAVTAGACVLLVDGWRRGGADHGGADRDAARRDDGRRERVYAAASIVVLWGAGAALGHVAWTKPAGAALPVALVQGAVPQDLKWQEDNRQHTLELYRSLTERAWGARIVVWPEAALPVLYHDVVVPYLRDIYAEAQRHHADLVFGLLRYDFAKQQYRNGLAAFGDEEQWYYKRRLVPFGEFFPVPSFIREWMRLKSLAYVDFAPGASDQPPLAAAGQLLGATICYEDAYAVEQLAVLDRATLLVNVSNDAWFGDSTAPHQHLQITRMRALEAGRWMMRATNNGVSALIDPHGRVVARTRQFEAEVLRGDVVPYTGLTPYARLRNWPVLAWLAAALAVGAFGGGARRERAGAVGERGGR